MDEKTIEKIRLGWQVGIWSTLLLGVLLSLVLFIFEFGHREKAYHYVMVGVFMFVAAFVVEMIVEAILFFRRHKGNSLIPGE
ncbi:MAG: hypothetical protein HQM13_01180 [SAR324 cluster bacterium]|nr:hypothetical protein [SAR324 cluster bacterium]